MESVHAMQGIELAVRRVSERLKGRTPWDMGVTEALDELANEISDLWSQAVAAKASDVSNGTRESEAR